MQDPQIQLQELGIGVPDMLDNRKAAVLDPAHRSFVDYEVFFFADEADKRRFDADPTGSISVARTNTADGSPPPCRPLTRSPTTSNSTARTRGRHRRPWHDRGW